MGAKPPGPKTRHRFESGHAARLSYSLRSCYVPAMLHQPLAARSREDAAFEAGETARECEHWDHSAAAAESAWRRG